MLRVYLAGRIAVEFDGVVLLRERQLRRRQERLALTYLALERAGPVSRSELADVLWPDEPPDGWPGALSAIVSRLRALLSAPELRAAGVELLGGAGQYQLRLPADTWVDVEAAYAALDTAEGALRADDGGAAFGPATVAVVIARRPLLSGVDSPWARTQRGRLERSRLRALECLGAVWLASDEPLLAIEAAVEALAVEPLRESSQRLLMRAHARAGNPAEALRSYQQLRRRLVDELGADPSSETEELYLSILG